MLGLVARVYVFCDKLSLLQDKGCSVSFFRLVTSLRGLDLLETVIGEKVVLVLLLRDVNHLLSWQVLVLLHHEGVMVIHGCERLIVMD